MWPGWKRYREVIHNKNNDFNELDNDLLFLMSQTVHGDEQDLKKQNDIRETVFRLNSGWMDFRQFLDEKTESNSNISRAYDLNDYQDESDYIQSRLKIENKTVAEWELDLRKLSKRVKQFNNVMWYFHNIHNESIDPEINYKITLCLEHTQRLLLPEHPLHQKHNQVLHEYTKLMQEISIEREKVIDVWPLARLQKQIATTKEKWEELYETIELRLCRAIYDYLNQMNSKQNKHASSILERKLIGVRNRSENYYQSLMKDLKLLDDFTLEMKAVTAFLVSQIAERAEIQRKAIEKSKGNEGDKELNTLIGKLIEIYTYSTGRQAQRLTYSNNVNYSGPLLDYIQPCLDILEVPYTSKDALGRRINQVVGPMSVSL